ncbi:hypothetical protein ACFLYG_04075 [Chloroflexota bacterium]
MERIADLLGRGELGNYSGRAYDILVYCTIISQTYHLKLPQRFCVLLRRALTWLISCPYVITLTVKRGHHFVTATDLN